MKIFSIFLSLILLSVIAGCGARPIIKYDSSGREFRCERHIAGDDYVTSVFVGNKKFAEIEGCPDLFAVSQNGKFVGVGVSVYDNYPYGNTYKVLVFNTDNAKSVYEFQLSCEELTPKVREGNSIDVEHLAIANNGRVALVYSNYKTNLKKNAIRKNRTCVLEIHDPGEGKIKERILHPLSAQLQRGNWYMRPTSLAISATGKIIVWAAGDSYYDLKGNQPKTKNNRNAVVYVWNIQQSQPVVIPTKKTALIYDICLDNDAGRMAYWYWPHDGNAKKREVVVRGAAGGKILGHRTIPGRVRCLYYDPKRKDFIVNNSMAVKAGG